MDMTAFYLHIAAELGANVCLYTKDNSFKQQISKRIDLRDPLREQEEIFAFLMREPAIEAPVLSTINGCITYALCEDETQRYLIGPVLTDPSVGIRRNRTVPDTLEDFQHLLYPCPLQILVSHLLLLHNVINPPGLSSLEFYNLGFSNRMVEHEARHQTAMEQFRRREYGEKHNPYDHELREMECITHGNTRGLKTVWNEETAGRLGVTAKDPVRSGKNLAIGVVVLASRAAVRGGLHYETAFSLCDSYEQKIEETRDPFKLEAVVHNAELTFAEMVKEIHTGRRASAEHSGSPMIAACKSYVDSNLHDKLTVQEVAEALRVHPTYLGTMFHKQEGISLYQYILGEKIRQAKSLLIYSSMSYLEIAHTLGFSSQSHLGTHFKKQTGHTLKEYREKYQFKGVSQ